MFNHDIGKLYKPNESGKNPDDVLIIPIVNPMSKERMGYPTQKPIALLDIIIKASCPLDGIVFDPFCGCGITIVSAQQNNRRWIGCDIAILSINLIKERLSIKQYGLEDKKDYIVSGIPSSMESVVQLAKDDKYQFQNWIIEFAGGFCSVKKSGESGDRGIDGKLLIEIGHKELKNMIISVKSGNVTTENIKYYVYLFSIIGKLYTVDN